MLTYGTLKKGFYNYDRFNCKHIKTIPQLTGYRMYNLGPYPMVVKTDNEEDVIKDLHVIDSPYKETIANMEIGAGYIVDNVEIDGETLAMFIANDHNAKDLLSSNDVEILEEWT